MHYPVTEFGMEGTAKQGLTNTDSVIIETVRKRVVDAMKSKFPETEIMRKRFVLESLVEEINRQKLEETEYHRNPFEETMNETVLDALHQAKQEPEMDAKSSHELVETESQRNPFEETMNETVLDALHQAKLEPGIKETELTGFQTPGISKENRNSKTVVDVKEPGMEGTAMDCLILRIQDIVKQHREN